MDWVVGVAIIVGLLTLPSAVALWEKRYVRAYGPPLDCLPPGMPEYSLRLYDAATDHGFVAFSAHQHVKYDIIAMFWFSPERDILVHGGAGKIYGMKTEQTWLISRLSNGRFLVTTDRFDEGDTTGLCETRRVLGGTLPELVEKHRARLVSTPNPADPFTEQNGADAREAIAREFADVVVRAGRARWVDLDETAWRCTPAGAARIWLNGFGQLGIGFAQAWRVINWNGTKPRASESSSEQIGEERSGCCRKR